ncbi:MAG: hypothetical protein HOP10_04245 [Chitinophagaceae bacterium]|nr:hypothetical protein [Chitinophagaceae bacterium]
MIKKKLSRPDYLIIAANLLPVLGVFVWDWSPVEVFMVYALETIIIGFFTLLKMGIVTAVRKTDDWHNAGKTTRQSGLFFMLFFVVHYGMFVAIQTGLFVQASGIGSKNNIGFFDFFIHWPRYLGPGAWYMITGFLISYGFGLIWNFLRTKQYKTIPMMILMFQPYGRIFIQQVTVILGSMFLSFGAGKIFILIFAIVKIFFEVFINYNGILNKAVDDMKKNEKM